MGSHNPKRASHRVPPPIPAGEYVCAVDGHAVKYTDIEHGIDNRLIGLCWACRRAEVAREAKRRLVPVVLRADYRAKPKATPQATPMALFSDAEAPRGFLDTSGRIVAMVEQAHGKARR